MSSNADNSRRTASKPRLPNPKLVRRSRHMTRRPADGGALQATARALREQSVEMKGSKALLSMNQPHGFDCPGCAWPDPEAHQLVRVLRERCQGRRLRTDEAGHRFFAEHTVSELAAQRLSAGGAGPAAWTDALRCGDRSLRSDDWDAAFDDDRPRI